METPEAEPENLGDRAQVRERDNRSKRYAREKKALLETIMNYKAGRRWVKELLEACHCYHTSFSKNALEMAFQEGQRNIGLQLLADLTASCPEQYVTMLQEKYDE